MTARLAMSFRRPETLAALHRRDALICEAAAVYFSGSSANDAAHRLHTTLQRYESGTWRPERSTDTCPPSGRDAQPFVERPEKRPGTADHLVTGLVAESYRALAQEA
jgi:hypothetical protein